MEALIKKLDTMGEGYDNSTVFVCHGDCLEEALQMKEQLLKREGVQEVFVGNLGAVIGSHAGPGTLALFFMGKHR
jgi:fatty acid-binding protein DegV